MQERFYLWKFLSFVISLHFTPFIISECFLYFQHLFEVAKVGVLYLRSAINHWYQDSTLLIFVMLWWLIFIFFQGSFWRYNQLSRKKELQLWRGQCGTTEKVAFSREKMILLQTSQTFLKKKSYTHLPKYHNMHSP